MSHEMEITIGQEHPNVSESQNPIKRVLQNTRMSRRRFSTVAAETTVGAVALATVGTGVITENPQNILGKQEAIEAPNETLFKRVFERINGIKDERARAEALDRAKTLETIMIRNDEFMAAHNSRLDENGKPMLTSLYEKDYKQFGVENAEGMIFFINNNKHADQWIVAPLQNMLDSDSLDPASIVDSIKKKLEDDETNEGEQRYYGGVHLRLRDYASIGTESGGVVEVVADDAFTQDEIEIMKPMDDQIRKLQAKMGKPFGKLKFHLLNENSTISKTTANADTDHADGENDFTIINLKPGWIDRTVWHEMGHYMNILQNDTQMAKHLTPGSMVDLIISEKQALQSKDWGVVYPDTRAIFEERTPIKKAVITGPSTATGIAPSTDIDKSLDPLTKLKKRRMDERKVDDYPDGIFYSGIDAYDGALTPGDRWLRTRDDEDVVREYSAMIQEGKSASLQEFLEGENSVVFDSMGEKSPLLAKTMGKLRELAPLIRNVSWIPDFKTLVANQPQSNRTWYEFATTVGNRIGVIELLKENDEVLSTLPESTKINFQDQLMSAFCVANGESFSNLLSLSVSDPELSAVLDSPHIKYLNLLNSVIQ